MLDGFLDRKTMAGKPIAVADLGEGPRGCAPLFFSEIAHFLLTAGIIFANSTFIVKPSKAGPPQLKVWISHWIVIQTN